MPSQLVGCGSNTGGLVSDGVVDVPYIGTGVRVQVCVCPFALPAINSKTKPSGETSSDVFITKEITESELDKLNNAADKASVWPM